MIEIVSIIVVILIVGGILFLNLAPQIGGNITKEEKEKYSQSNNYKKGKFRNKKEVSMVSEVKFKTFGDMIKNKNTIPKHNLPIKDYKLGNSKETKVVWFGHSALLIEIDGKNILLDPMLTERPSPVPVFVGKRFKTDVPIDISEIKNIHGVLISHDHYDHLDYSSIKKIKDNVERFYVPLGVGAHLRRWGVERSKIIELDWWQESNIGNIIVAATPSQHFSGRGVFNGNSTLWCSWVIKGSKETLFFSGDTGYHNGFKEIGEKYGPFDLTMMECGQYNESWASIHMMPEQTVKAHIDLKGKVLLPIHWAAFKLSIHPWNEPASRSVSEAERLKVKVITPNIGEEIIIGKENVDNNWWK